MAKVCVKCGYERKPEDTAQGFECPNCGVIYEKAEAALQVKNVLPKIEVRRSVIPESITAQQSESKTSLNPQKAENTARVRNSFDRLEEKIDSAFMPAAKNPFSSRDQHLADIRDFSAYPAFRFVIKSVTGLGYAIAGLGSIGVLVAFFFGDWKFSVLGFIVVGFLFWLVAIKVFSELSHMLVDMADSMLIQASRSSETE